MHNEAELVLDAKAILGEGPCWDDQKNVLYWIDIAGKQLHIYDPRNNKDIVIETAERVTAVAPRKLGGLVLAAEHGFYTLDLETENMTSITNPEKHLPNNRFNDGKCDAMGRFWAGTMDEDGEVDCGALYCLDVDFRVRKVLNPVSCSNGIAWDAKNETLYYIDTPTMQVAAFDFDLASGTVRNKRIAVTIPEDQGVPDGMTIDAEGMLWVAHWGGYRVSRWNPQTGQCTEQVRVPVAKVTSCVFGGEQLNELYITTASIGLNEQELREQPYAGGVFKVKTDVKGTRTYRFNG